MNKGNNSVIINVCVKLISAYQRVLSPDTGIVRHLHIFHSPACVFYPTCSEYTKEAIIRHGVFHGVWLGICRIARCHPYQKKHIDLVP